MALNKVIREMLVASPNLLALVPVNNIFAIIITQKGAYPAVVFQLEGMVPSDVKGQDLKVDFYEYDIHSVSKDPDEAHAIDAEVRKALDKKSGTFDNKNINGVQLINTSDSYDHERAKAYIVTSRYRFKHNK